MFGCCMTDMTDLIGWHLVYRGIGKSRAAEHHKNVLKIGPELTTLKQN